MFVVILVELSSCQGGKTWNFIGKTVIMLFDDMVLVCSSVRLSEGSFFYSFTGLQNANSTLVAFQQVN